MNKKAVLKQLESPYSHERFMAAHLLLELVDLDDLPVLNSARRAEKDAYVIQRLDVLIQKVNNSYSRNPEPTHIAPTQNDQSLAKSEALAEFSALMLHELGPTIGLIALHAQEEISNYDASETAYHINRLQLAFQGIEELRSASKSHIHEYFNLSDFIKDLAHKEIPKFIDKVSFTGKTPLTLNSSKNLLMLAFSNGLKNAIEAINIMGPRTNGDTSIVISWGETDTEYWISIIDNGVGIRDGLIEKLSKIGQTTKNGHLGYGLAIVHEAMKNLNGKVDLYSDQEHTTFKISWRKNSENINS